MPDLTRAEALARASAELERLAGSIKVEQDGHHEYVAGLVAHWDARLSELSRLGPRTPVSPQVMAALRFLTGTVRGDLDPDARLHWLDAFPEAVADLFPPSAATFSLEMELEQALPRRSTRTALARAA